MPPTDRSTFIPWSKLTSFVLAVSLGASFAANCAREPDAGAAVEEVSLPPNFIVISLDAVRFDATSLSGQNDNTPFLGRMARQRGVNFTNAYSTFDQTPSSHFSMLTGLVHGAHSENLDRPEYSIAHQLKRLGYRTFGVSANGNLSPKAIPSLGAFDDYEVLYDSWTEMTPDEVEAASPRLREIIQRYRGRDNAFNRAILFLSADLPLQWLKQRITDASRESDPFFAFVNLIDAHDPFFPNPDFLDPVDQGSKVFDDGFEPDLRFRTLSPELRNPERIEDPERRDYIQTRIGLAHGRPWSVATDLSDEARKKYRRLYEAEIRELDDHMKNFFAFLSDVGVLDSTIVIVTSDHGEAFGEDDMLTHSFDNVIAFEATHHVPLLFIFPPGFDVQPSAVPAFCSIADIAPTIYDLLGIDWTPLALQSGSTWNFGRSLFPWLRIGPPDWNRRTSLDTSSNHRPNREGSARPDPRDEAVKRLKALGYLQ